jgi:hypothetical protein
MKNELIEVVIPLRCVEKVRDSCWVIIDIIDELIDLIRFMICQNDICIGMITSITVIIVSLGFILLNVIGSKDEKMSGIIKIWNYQLELWRFLVYLT